MKYTNYILRKVHALLDDYMICLLDKVCAKINFKFLDEKGGKFMNFKRYSKKSK